MLARFAIMLDALRDTLGGTTEEDLEARSEVVLDIVVSALLCHCTRVVAYHTYQGSPTDCDEATFHAWAHERCQQARPG